MWETVKPKIKGINWIVLIFFWITTSLSSSCLIFRKIKRDLSQTFGVRLFASPGEQGMPGCTKHFLASEQGWVSRHFPPVPEMHHASKCVTLMEQGGTVILFPLLNCATLRGVEQKTAIQQLHSLIVPRNGWGGKRWARKTLHSP